MADYNEATLSGTRWTRAASIHISNPHDGPKTVTFHEEDLAVLSDGTKVNTPRGHISVVFSDPAATVALRNPITNELTGGTITHGEIYAILQSIYMQVATDRDAAAAAPAPAPEPAP